MNVLHVVGSRPAFLRLSPVLRALRSAAEKQVIVYAGDRSDLAPEDRFLRDLGLPAPDFVLGGGGGSSALRTGRAVIALEPIVSRCEPDWIFAVGDVDATLAAALVARKNGIPLAHLEAGVRSGDERSPAEINRFLTDRLADLLFTAESEADDTLRTEGITPERIHRVGNVIADAIDQLHDRAAELDLPAVMQLEPGSYLLALLRPERGADEDRLAGLLMALDATAVETGRPTLLVMEPAFAADVRRCRLEHLLAPLTVMEPVGYVELLGLVQGAAVVVTDASEIPDVATLLGIPCVTVGGEPIHTAAGRHSCTDGVSPGDADGLVEAARRGLVTSRRAHRPDLWDGRAAERIARVTWARMPALAG